jgi:hypothetical protein
MANSSLKPASDSSSENTLRGSYNDMNKTFGVDGFLVGRVGHKVELAIGTTNVANDTETYTFSDNGTILYVLEIIYTSGSRDTLLSAERIA